MTKFELHEDYRTATGEALKVLGLDRAAISTATNYIELFEHLTPSKKQIALAAVEVYKMFSFRERRTQIYCSKDIFEEMKPCLTDLEVEESWVILLNQAHRVIKKVRISVGGISGTSVDIRVILKEAITASASAIALVHNHPSGNTRPSREDDQITKQLNAASDFMTIRLIDHLIFSNDGFYSYADEGRI